MSPAVALDVGPDAGTLICHKSSRPAPVSIDNLIDIVHEADSLGDCYYHRGALNPGGAIVIMDQMALPW
jgi:hypothetical protein